MGSFLLTLHHPNPCVISIPGYCSCHNFLFTKFPRGQSTRCCGARRRRDGGLFGIFSEEELGGTAKRSWWSEYDEDYDSEEDYDAGFWIFELLGAFSWMLPAVGISLLLETGPNTVLTAIAAPLARFVISLVIDKVQDRKTNRPRVRYKTRPMKRPFTRAANANNTRRSKARQEENVGGRDFGSHKTDSRFGGWDDLDIPRG